MKKKNEHVVIIGTGFSGLGMAIRLKQEGIHDFTILEAAAGIGGTWRDNTYPGAACDIESHLYSFSFEPNPEWSRTYAEQGEILRYLERCAEKYGLLPHIRFSTGVLRARFDERAGVWNVETTRGDTIRARVVVSGCGGLTRPVTPDIPGLEDFRGARFHSARWDHQTSLDGKRVAVIGTGASAIQIVPEVAKKAARLEVFQRTAPWVMPKNDPPYSDADRARFRARPITQRLARADMWLRHELTVIPFVAAPSIMRFAERLALRDLAKAVPDPVLRAKVTPRFRLGCKRVLLSNDYYPALARPNVDVVTDPIARIEADGIVTNDGKKHAIDALILATGFEAAEQLAPFEIRGRGGRDLNEAWADGAEAYLGTAVSGFPNWFMIFGPNTALGHSSMVYMIESQIAYALGAIRTMRARGLKMVDVRPAVQAAYNARLQKRFSGTVWSSGCVSWYRTAKGKITTLWPGSTLEFRLRTRRFDAECYEVAHDDAAEDAPATTVAREIAAPMN